MIDQLVETYIKLRDKKAELEAAHKHNVGPITEGMTKIEAALLAEMQKQGTSSVAVKGIGTAYTTTKTSVTMAEWDSYLEFIREQEDPYRFLDRKPNKTAVEEYMDEHQDVPPGINLRRELAVNIRRG